MSTSSSKKKSSPRMQREEAKEKRRPALRERQARFRKEKAKSTVRLELRITKETEAFLSTLTQRAGKRHKNIYGAELLTEIVELRYKKMMKNVPEKKTAATQEDFDF